MRKVLFISHPNVVISKDVPVPQWPLSSLGRERMRAALGQPWTSKISSLYCSTEQKAIDGAEILACHLSLPFTPIHELGENDRSATGFLPPEEFEQMADQFFARPEESVRGWETALAAQQRIVAAVNALVQADTCAGTIAIVSHGAVGTLLYCHLSGQPIDRRWDQPPNGGGNVYSFQLNPTRVFSWWRPIDEGNA
ncbi:phosphoglycerate mutase family protein [Paucibacter sp. TC2R-5]|uniref:histidine phosphatase family protein n=1 Tax=Paucibacter sp. TC2R-5 TaxID=2893555 RepID=UPI0021E3704F|nr:histidine phosphatase family protein [Paucibacter sp. TC2R-5]MCV2361611.1 phosphoglycerate mutase family protein [Paucibacter sp. TC2R-5]